MAFLDAGVATVVIEGVIEGVVAPEASTWVLLVNDGWGLIRR